MAKITVARLPTASKEYSVSQFNILIRQLEQLLTQLNFSYQEGLKEEVNTRSWYLG